MSIRAVILLTVCFATILSCMAQVTGEVYPQNIDENACYI